MNSFFAFLTYLLVVGSVLFLTYVVSKYLGNKSKKMNRGRNIKVIDSVSIGIDKWLILVQAGNRVLLLCSSGKNIQLLSEMSDKDIVIEEEDSFNSGDKAPTNLFDRYLNVFKNYMNIDEKHTSLRDEKSIYNKKDIFGGNLEKLKGKFSGMQDKSVKK